ncbi:MAG: ExbD/TolR family protein [Sphingomonadales bacterium]
MRRRGTQDGDDAKMDLTPMLDVVFIMLIFFIVTASFIKEAGVQVLKPDALTGERKPMANILIAITPKGQIWIQRKRVDIRAVRANIERLHAENPQGSIVIQADNESETGLVIQVMEAARLAGVQNVSIATKEPR